MTIFSSALIFLTVPCLPNFVFSLGRVFATAIQIAPVPPWAGKRNVALGPQFPAVFSRITFFTTPFTLGAATRSPSHAHCICGASIHWDLGVSCRIAAYLRSWYSPDLEVVGSHEDICDTHSHLPQDPLVKCFGFRVGDASFQSCVNQTIHTSDLLRLGQHGYVILKWIGDP